jgi:hypothetical protein
MNDKREPIRTPSEEDIAELDKAIERRMNTIRDGNAREYDYLTLASMCQKRAAFMRGAGR